MERGEADLANSGQPSSTTGHEGDGETCDKKHEPELVKSPRAESKDVHEADIPSLREVDLSPQVHCEEAVSGGINTRLFSGQTGNAAKGRQLRETMARVPSNMEGNVKQGNQSKCGPTNLGSRVAGTDSGRGPLVRGVGKVFCSHDLLLKREEREAVWKQIRKGDHREEVMRPTPPFHNWSCHPRVAETLRNRRSRCPECCRYGLPSQRCYKETPGWAGRGGTGRGVETAENGRNPS